LYTGLVQFPFKAKKELGPTVQPVQQNQSPDMDINEGGVGFNDDLIDSEYIEEPPPYLHYIAYMIILM